MSFLQDLERGKIGEEIFIKQARHYFGKDRVMDLRGTIIERAYDVDFATPWSNKDYTCMDWCKIEVKTDYQARWTGNLCFEYTSSENGLKTTPGCFMRTDADLLVYYLYGTDDVYIMETNTLKAFALNHSERWKTRRNEKGGLLYLIPLEELEDCGIAVKLNFKRKNIFKVIFN